MSLRAPSLPGVLACVAVTLLLVVAGPGAQAQVSLTSLGTPYTQNFNTLATAGTTNDLPTAVPGWAMNETGGGARDNDLYAADTGGSGTGDTYSYGAAASSERALGELRSGTLIPNFGAAFQNNTGGTITSLDIAYTGEQWRLGTVTRLDRIDFQYSLDATSLTTGTWTDVNTLDFTAPNTGPTLGILDGNAGANRTALSDTIPALSIANGATFWIRWQDLDASGADDGLSVDDFSLTPNGTGGGIALTINDVTVTEGDAGTVTAHFVVSLSAPAPVGGVTFDVATADGSALDSDNDYEPRTDIGATILQNNQTYGFDVTVNGDVTVEPNQTFSVNVTNVSGTGVIVADSQGVGTINNDDVTLTPIHDIQGNGNSSPIVSTTVTTRGVVTGVKSNGFFIQEADATIDADPATSEGILVFTSSAPPVAAAVGNLVQVSGTVQEFVPSQDPLQPPLTEIGGSPSVALVTPAQPLPAAIPLTPTFPDPSVANVQQLERLEGMRVSVASMTVVAPTLGNVSEPNATATSIGTFYGVVTGVARPFREAGIQADDPGPTQCTAPCTFPPLPRFDANPERIRVTSTAIGGATIDVNTGATLTGLVGPLDYGFRTYTIAPEPASPPIVAGGMTPTPVTTPTAEEFTVAGFNLERFFNTTNDGIGEPVLTGPAYSNRLGKASAAIRDYLLTPDIVGVVEVENIATLTDLANQINADAVAASQPNPLYTAHLLEGNDIGGIDVGFLVKTAEVSAGQPRVTLNQPAFQYEPGFTWADPCGSPTTLLHDRPPLQLDADVHHAAGASFTVRVVVVHNRSLGSVNSESTTTCTPPQTVGDRVRSKRQLQGQRVALLMESLQATPTVVVGDFNAFEVNDGYADAMNTIVGTPAADDTTAVLGDGADLVTIDLTNLTSLEPAGERYSYSFDGNAQSLDHILVNDALLGAMLSSPGIDHARIDADFAEVARNNYGAGVPTRISDHDPAVGYFRPTTFPVELQSFTIE